MNRDKGLPQPLSIGLDSGTAASERCEMEESYEGLEKIFCERWLSVCRAGRSLDQFDGCEPGGCAVFVERRMNAVWFESGDVPCVGGAECGSQFPLADGMRAGIGTVVTEAQYVQSSVVVGYRRQTRRVSWPLFGVEGVEESGIQHGLKGALQAL